MQDQRSNVKEDQDSKMEGREDALFITSLVTMLGSVLIERECPNRRDTPRDDDNNNHNNFRGNNNQRNGRFKGKKDAPATQHGNG